MENIPKDVLILIAVELDIHSLLRFCATNKANRKICDNPYLWIRKLKKDFSFDFENIISFEHNPKQYYFKILANLYNLNGGMLFAIKDRQDDLARYFIGKGADDLYEGLKWAAQYGRKEIVNFLIPKIKTKINWQELASYAGIGGHRDLVGDFLDKNEL